MSYFDDASLVMIPSGYKDQKVYSVKPLDGSGDLTFSRASNATRVASNGLIEKVRTNVLTYSQDFSNANWVPFDASRTGSQTDPNGGTTASLYTSLTNSANLSANFATASSSPYTFSIYIKGTSSGSVSLRVDSGSTAAQNNISYTTSWQRFTYTFTAGASTSSFVLGGYASFTTGEGIYVAFAQAELGDIATDYIATTSAAVSVGPVSGLPRLDYLNSTCPRLLLEPQRTNLITYSEQFNNAVWAATRASFTANQTTAPDGYTGADLYTDGTFTGNVSFVEQAVVVGGSGTTYSVFVKKGTANFIQFGFYDTDFHGFVVNTTTWATTHTFGSASLFTATNYGNGWYRLSMYKAAASNTIYASVAVCGNSTGANYNGTGSLTAYFWGAQIEGSNSAYATSYIPTLGTSVTRVADAASKTGISSLIGQTEGTIYWEGKVDGLAPINESLPISLFATGATTSGAQIYVTFLANGRISFVVYDGGVQAQVQTTTSFYTLGTNIKIAAVYKANDFALYINGVQIGTDTSGSVVAASELYLDYKNNVGNYSTSQLLLFKTRLTNAQLAELTTL